jgi:hypothetical protein
MEINIVEIITKRFVFFVNNNHTKLLNEYNENIEENIKSNCSFPVWCMVHFNMNYDRLVENDKDLIMYKATLKEIINSSTIK